MTVDADFEKRLTAWLRTRLPDSDDVRVEGLDRVSFGHSAEMMMLTVVTQDGDRETRQDMVLRLRPKPPALLEPYDLARQFRILCALQDTAVRVPRALWLEESGDVLGRPFFVMQRVAGDVYEMQPPAGVADSHRGADVREHGRATRGDPFGRPRPRPGSTRSMMAASISTGNSATGPRR